MKRTLFFMLLSAWLSAPAAWAYNYDFEADGIYYNITSSDDKTVEVTSKTGYSSDYSGDVTILATVTNEGIEYRVTAIGYRAFLDCYHLTSVTIPESVTTIGEEAFYECTGLKSVKIPENVTIINDETFYNCKSLTEITIPNKVTTIGDYAFEYCENLTSVTIPESVTAIGDGAFLGCDGLKNLDGKFATADHRCLVINDTLKAFAPSGLTQYTIPNEVKVICGGVFSGCTSLTSVTIPNGVTAIGDEAFSSCGLTTVTIPESVTTIGEAAFYRCLDLTSITIGDGVTTIGDEAFQYCENLTSVTIGESVQIIGSFAFYNCGNLDNFDGKFATTDHRCLVINDTLIAFAPSGLTQYTIPDEVKVIGDWAFYNCWNLKSVKIGESVTSIGSWAFDGCTGLTNFDGKIATADHRCLVINDTLIAFARSGLTQYTIPDGVKVIGSYAFYECTGLKSVTIPNSVTTIGHYAFYNCSGLTEITIPNSVTTIGNSAFFRCEGLNSVTIGEGVQTIGDFAFQRCENLTSVTIGKNVTTIGTAAFLMCYGLTSVTAYNQTPVAVNTDLFAGVDCANCKLYVPKGSVDDYKAAEGWSEFGEILPIDESSAITEIRQDNADGHITVYNLQGVPVLETDDAADLKTLQNGAYIVNGKKMVITR